MKIYVNEKNIKKITNTQIAIIEIPFGEHKGKTIAYKTDRLKPTYKGYVLNCSNTFKFALLDEKNEKTIVEASEVEKAFESDFTRLDALKTLAWQVEKEKDGVCIAYSDEDDYIVVDKQALEKTVSPTLTATTTYVLNDRAIENLAFNLCENEEEANFIFDNYYFVEQTSKTETYKQYLIDLKKNYPENEWYTVARTLDEFEEVYSYEKSKQKIDNYVNHRLYEKHTPYALRHTNRFIVWKWEMVGDRATKMPYNPRKPNEKARSNDYTTWGSFERAVDVINNSKDFAGLGVMLGRGLMGIDFDHCIKDGVIDEEKERIIEAIGGYTEYSPSGDGIHILVFDTKDEQAYRSNNKIEGIEVYDDGRFFTLTGNVYKGYKAMKKKSETAEAVREFLDKYLKKDESQIKNVINKENLTRNVREVSDSKVIEVIEKSLHGNNFKRMYYENDIPLDKYGKYMTTCLRQKEGSVPADDLSKLSNEELLKFYEKDQSGCDWVMAGILAKFCASTDQMDRIFRSSKMMREKWDRKINADLTYGQSVCMTRFSQNKGWVYNPDFYREKYKTNRKTKQYKIQKNDNYLD